MFRGVRLATLTRGWPLSASNTERSGSTPNESIPGSAPPGFNMESASNSRQSAASHRYVWRASSAFNNTLRPENTASTPMEAPPLAAA
jgi:hypothetical protein